MDRKPGHLALAKKLAEDSGRHISECLGEAAEILLRSQNETRAHKLRVTYFVLSVGFAILVGLGIGEMRGVLLGAVPEWLSLVTLLFGLAGIFWVAPELPLLSIFWTRWNTPLFIVLMLAALWVEPRTAEVLLGFAKCMYFGVALIAAGTGLIDPQRALDCRLNVSRLLFHKLTPKDQARLFFLAPWIDPFRFRVRR